MDICKRRQSEIAMLVTSFRQLMHFDAFGTLTMRRRADD